MTLSEPTADQKRDLGVANGLLVEEASGNAARARFNSTTPTSAAAGSSRGGDRVELSGSVGTFLQQLRNGGDVRTEKVAAIRSQLEAGTYNEDAKLDFAIEKLLDEVV
jgi:anti-sigma28 factor (negative regulator of flagellin synthesis)